MRALGSLENGPAFAPQGRPGRLNGADPGLRAQVDRWRTQGASWDAIGRMLRRPGADVRAAFDADYLRAPEPVAAEAKAGPAAKRTVRGNRHGAGVGPAELAALALVARRERLPREAAEALGVARVTATTRLKVLREAGLASRNTNGTWTATRAGRMALAGGQA